MRRGIAVLLVAVFTAGCYHATVNLTPQAGVTQQAQMTGQVVDMPWANGFIYGLVAPAPVNGSAACPSGVAKVETEHSFLNMLAGGITFGIYTPVHITITCNPAH